MSRTYFRQIESEVENFELELDHFLSQLNFDQQGLIPAIAQDHKTQQVLMLAWMDKTAIARTLQTKKVCYWSRSRRCYWVKGEVSGHTQELLSMYADCDGDAILLQVKQQGDACHTQRHSCFFWRFDSQKQKVYCSSEAGNE